MLTKRRYSTTRTSTKNKQIWKGYTLDNECLNAFRLLKKWHMTGSEFHGAITRALKSDGLNLVVACCSMVDKCGHAMVSCYKSLKIY